MSSSDWKMHEKYDPAVGNNYDVCMIRVNEDFVQRILDSEKELEIPCLGKFNHLYTVKFYVLESISSSHLPSIRQ